MIKAVLLNDTRIDRHHGCTTVIETIGHLCAKSGIAITAYSPAHSDWRADSAIIEAIKGADLVLVNGEGTIHHDRPAGIKLLEAGHFARKHGVKSALINATWEANGAGSLRALELFDIVTVRESASLAELAGHGINARRIPDLALYHQPPLAAQRSGVGYCDSVQGPKALAIYQQMWPLGAAPLPLVQLDFQPMTILRWLLRYGPSKAAIFCPVHAMKSLRATIQDYREQEPSRNVTTSKVASKQLVVTGRFHMLIFCLGARTPVLVIGSNTHKNQATLADAGLEPWRLIADPASIDEALIARSSQWHGKEAAGLDSFLNHGRNAMETLFDDLAALVRD
ncbi:MAG: polysaccharide pyruvyl transferase family protein [Pontixanthobacter sp.]